MMTTWDEYLDEQDAELRQERRSKYEHTDDVVFLGRVMYDDDIMSGMLFRVIEEDEFYSVNTVVHRIMEENGEYE